MKRKCLVVVIFTVLMAANALARTGRASGPPAEKGVHQAYVRGDGSFQTHSKDVLAVARTGSGVYRITMKKAVATCAVTATIALDGNGNGFVATYFASAVSPQTIGVSTTNGAGSPTDRDFFLIVACAR